MGVPAEFKNALLVGAKTGQVEIQDVQIDAAVAVRCLCGGEKTVFIARITKPGACPSCERPYFVKNLQVRPDGSAYDIAVGIQPGLTPEEATRAAAAAQN
ncbi:MAG: hypothetical protein ABI634_14090 [Acidobacteriota bacterium]